MVLFDEVHIFPSLRYRESHIVGYSDDEPHKLARTILVLMVRPLMGGCAFIARLIPTFSLKPENLYEQLTRLISIIHPSGGFVVALMCDNHPAKFNEAVG